MSDGLTLKFSLFAEVPSLVYLKQLSLSDNQIYWHSATGIWPSLAQAVRIISWWGDEQRSDNQNIPQLPPSPPTTLLAVTQALCFTHNNVQWDDKFEEAWVYYPELGSGKKMGSCTKRLLRATRLCFVSDHFPERGCRQDGEQTKIFWKIIPHLSSVKLYRIFYQEIKCLKSSQILW